jgi:hypothetical protein
VKGTADWTPYSVVLDASADAQGIFFGILMSGEGQMWISDVRFEVVDSSVSSTGSTPRTEPGNLELTR